jgi:hypothetical protein
MDPINSPSSAAPSPETGEHFAWAPWQDPSAPTRLEKIPKEVGALLLTTGIIMGVLPPPPGPFDLSVMLAGGVALWPRGLRAIEVWTRRRFPRAHRAGIGFLDRYLDDLEHRYPGATNAVEYERLVFTQMLSDMARGDLRATRRETPPAGLTDDNPPRPGQRTGPAVELDRSGEERPAQGINEILFPPEREQEVA